MSADKSGFTTRFGIQVWKLSESSVPLYDPYNNSPLDLLEIEAISYGSGLSGYSLEIKNRLVSNGYSSVYYGVDKNGVETHRTGSEPLTDDHARALFDLVDSLIPQASPQLPEPTGEGEQ